MTTWRRVVQSCDGVMEGGGERPQPPVGRMEGVMVIQGRVCGDGDDNADDDDDDDGDDDAASSKGRS